VKLSERLRFPGGKADGLFNMGRYHYSKSENEQAADYFLESMKRCEEHGFKAGISQNLDYLGKVAWKTGDYEAALDHFEASLKLARELGDDGLIAASIASFGTLSLQKGHYQEALQAGDTVYLFSDGYVDQLGGPKRKSFRSKRFRELLVKNHHRNMREQQQLLERTLDEWQGDHEQIDDILVLGFRI